MSKFKYEFDVEIIREGQPRRYADNEYEYIIKSDKASYIVEQFCKHILKQPFNGDYEFDLIDENTYRYYVCIPFTD